MNNDNNINFLLEIKRKLETEIYILSQQRATNSKMDTMLNMTTPDFKAIDGKLLFEEYCNLNVENDDILFKKKCLFGKTLDIIRKKCNHTWEEDWIDTCYDETQRVKYCSKCGINY